MRRRPMSDQGPRWYAALAPKRPARLKAKTAAAARALPVSAKATSATPAGMERKKAIWCRRPRIRGFWIISTDGGYLVQPSDLGPDLDDLAADPGIVRAQTDRGRASSHASVVE